MKKNQLLLAIVLSIFTALSVNATVWRINNITGISCNFATPALAVASASVLAGDTLHIEPSTVSYGDVTLTKKLTIIGVGYFLSENPQTQASPTPSTLGIINFNAGSQYSKITGLTTGNININTPYITITRNNIKGVVNLGVGITDLSLDKNYIQLDVNGNTLYCGSNVNRITIMNNYIQNNNATSGLAYYAVNFQAGFNGIMKNNIIKGNMVLFNTTLTNNIMIVGTVAMTSCISTNNIGVGTQFGTTNSNQQNVPQANIFVGLPNSTDGQWQLKSTSPAKAAGTEGEDCGIYGGCNPYILSGIPNIPAIYYIKPLRINNTTHILNIDTIKVKSHY